MPKLKTHSGASKRVKVTKNKKFKITKANRRHLLQSKSPKKSQALRQSTFVNKADVGKLHQLLPYA